MSDLMQADSGSWELDGEELISGTTIEVELGGHWILGQIDYSWSVDTYVILIPRSRATVLMEDCLSIRRPENTQ